MRKLNEALMQPILSISSRIRSTPFTERVKAAGVKAYTVYNHMLLPTVFNSLEEDYHHLKKNVQVWDVSVERQIEIQGPDSQTLIQMISVIIYQLWMIVAEC
jgi:dimethylsulfoniopropionate demethylase